MAGAAPALREPVHASRRSKPVLLAIVAVARSRRSRTSSIDRLWISHSAARSLRHRLHPAAALDRGAAVRELERGQGAGVLLRRAHRGAAQLARRDQRAAGRRPHLGVLVQRQDTDIGTIARKLNVGAVLEGSVRRSAHTIRITAQLINAVTGFHLWSKTYDRDLGDVLKLQTEIATAVASALKVTLLGDVAAKVELGGTRNPAAFDAYLRGAKAVSSRHDAKDLPAAIAAYTEAIRLDPHYALAFAGRSIALSDSPRRPRPQRRRVKALTRRRRMRARRSRSRRIWPRPTSHWRPFRKQDTLDFTQASEEYERALALAPGNAQVLRISGAFAAYMGHFDAGLAAARRAVVLDPLARETL